MARWDQTGAGTDRESRRLGPAVVVPIVVAGSCLLAGYVVARVAGFRPDHLTRDTVNLTGARPYIGLFSMAGVMLWIASAALLLTTGAAVGDDARRRSFLLWFGGALAFLAVDDGFVLHDRVLKQQLGLRETVTLPVYLLAILVILACYRDVVRALGHVVVLQVAGLWFAGSLLLDRRPHAWNAVGPRGTIEFVEDGLKVVGLAVMLGWAVVVCRDEWNRPGRLRSATDPPTDSAATPGSSPLVVGRGERDRAAPHA